MPKRFSITLSDDLYEAVKILMKRRKYRTLTEYLAALARYDGQSQREHHLTAEWAAMEGHERDALDARILALVQSGKGVTGSWLEARIATIIKEHLAHDHVPTKKEVATQLARDIAKP